MAAPNSLKLAEPFPSAAWEVSSREGQIASASRDDFSFLVGDDQAYIRKAPREAVEDASDRWRRSRNQTVVQIEGMKI